MAEDKIIGQLKESNSELNVEWQIADFFSLKEKVDTFYESNLFHFLDKTWYLQICPNGEAENNSEGFIALYLIIEKSAPSKHVTFSFSLKTSDGVKEKLFEDKYVFNEDNCGWGPYCALSRSDLFQRKSELAPSDVLTVICTLKYDSDDAEGDEPVTVEASSQTETTECLDKLQQEFKELLLSGKNSDITLNVKGKEFTAHKNIIAARSPIFSAMVEHEMREKATGMVTIEDSDPDTFPDFLQYLYTARVENLTSEKALNLYTTADKYQVNELKNVCLEYMLANISLENFCDFLTLSLRHHEKELTDAASQFFVQNSMTIVLTTKWQVFLGENPVAGNELLIKLIREKLQ